jgi:exosome complex component RRP42
MNIDRELKRHFVTRMIDNGRRIDGRDYDAFRNIEITTNVISDKAEGSARIKLGETDVLVGIKIETMTPWPDAPDTGIIMTGAELGPIASPDFETGRPSPEAIELARVVDRGIRESHMIDLEKLVIAEGETVWSVAIDAHILDHDGNLLDATSIAAVAALCTTWVPKYEDGKIVRERSMDLPITRVPISCTFAKIKDAILIDPCLDEEFAMDARLTVTTTGDQIHAMQKGLDGAFTPDEVSQAVDRSMAKYKTLKKLIK